MSVSEMARKDEEAYVDKTGTDDKPNPMRDAYLEFPRALTEVAQVTRLGAVKHAPRGWRTFETGYALDYHMSKIGRHLRDLELDGPLNHKDHCDVTRVTPTHMAQVAWNALAYLEHYLKHEEEGKVDWDNLNLPAMK